MNTAEIISLILLTVCFINHRDHHKGVIFRSFRVLTLQPQMTVSMKNRINTLSLVALTLIVAGCTKTEKTDHQFLPISRFDSSVRPGTNFFRYVHGNWYDTVRIPPSQVGTGSFLDLIVKSNKALRQVCEEAANVHDAPLGSVEQRVGDLYTSFMDSVSINNKGYAPLAPLFGKIQGLKNYEDMIRFVADEMSKGNSLLFNFNVGPDDKNSNVNIAFLSQGGLGLPDRDYYFRNDGETARVQEAYRAYLSSLFILTGSDSSTASKNAASVYEVEKKLASGHFTNVEVRDPQKNYNKKATKDLNFPASALNWVSLLDGLRLKTDSIVISQPKFFDQLEKLLKSISINQWQLYLKASTLTNYGFALSTLFTDARFEFFGKTLYGQQQQKPRWERAVALVDGAIGELSGQLYVKKNFDEQAKERVMNMIDNIQLSYERHIKSLDWMSDSTKKLALAKLSTFKRKIGYPDRWKTYDGLQIGADSYFQNLVNINKFNYQEMIDKAGKPVDKSEWQLTPPTVNAFYNAANNDIMFLAGILQPPLFDPRADDAINYGGIGMVIGHELTHGFDDEGRQYDKDGNLKDWWTKEDAAKFTMKSKAVIDQYNAYVAIDTFHINGALTLGENIADIGGLAIAFDAFRMTQQSRDGKLIDGLTPEQRFFLSFATIWGIKLKDEFMKVLAKTDVHSPAEFRVLGPLSNFTPFYEAFKLKKGDNMWKDAEDRIVIW